MIRSLCLALGVAGILSGGAANAEPISMNGSTTVMNEVVIPKKAQIEAASGRQLVVVGNGSQRGLADLIADKANIAMISAPLDEEVKKINEKQPGAIDPASLTAHPIGESRVAFVVHPSNPVRFLSNVSLGGILAGRFTNWKEVGGPDQAIIVVAAQSGDGVRTTVEGRLLKGGDLTKDARTLTNATQIVKVISQLPGGIGLTAAVSLDASVAELKGDAVIAQPLFLVTKGNVSPDIRRVIEAAAKAGQS